MLSIATISFNQGAFLDRAIASVVSQLSDEDEYIVIDGGSNDESVRIIESYRSNIRYWHTRKDEGPADALNMALNVATKPYFYYINADDYVLPGSLERLRNYLVSCPTTGFAYGHGWTNDAAVHGLRFRYSDRWDIRGYARGVCSVVQQSTVIATSAMRAIDGFNVNNRTCWDGELLFDLSRSGYQAERLPFTIGVFRIHAESITGSARNTVRYHADRDRIAASIGEEFRPLQHRHLVERSCRRSVRLARAVVAKSIAVRRL